MEAPARDMSRFHHKRSCDYVDVSPEDAEEYGRYFDFRAQEQEASTMNMDGEQELVFGSEAAEDAEVHLNNTSKMRGEEKEIYKPWRRQLPRKRRYWIASLRWWWLVNVGLPLFVLYLSSFLAPHDMIAAKTRSKNLVKQMDALWMQWFVGQDDLFASVAHVTEYLGIDRAMFHFTILLSAVSSVLFILRRLFSFLYSIYRKPVYLLDYATLKPGNDLMIDRDWFMAKTHALKAAGVYIEESANFQERILAKSNISDKTYLPRFLVLSPLEHVPPQHSTELGREEAEYVFRRVVRDALDRTGISAKQVTHLIVNCSLLCTTPSLSSMIINMFGLRSDVKSFNLGGMGCSAGLVAIDLAKDLLRASTGKAIALVVSTESITNSWYIGNEKGYLLSNGLFRLGGAAMVLSNQTRHRRRAKFEFVDAVRVHLGADAEAYESVFQLTDSAGNNGVRLSRELINVAGKGVTQNLTRLLTRNLFLLPTGDLLRAVRTTVHKTLFGKGKKVKPFVPRFSRIFDHFCIHAGGRAVLDTMAEQLGLQHEQIQPSRAALWRFGNTSSASCWYEMEWIEGRGISKGDMVLQMAFGSGFKANSVIWRTL